jgi:hypothetical protein
MNKLLIIILSLGIAASAAAQPKIGGPARQSTRINRGGGYTGGKPNVTVVVPAYPVNPYYGLGYRNFYGPRLGLGFGYSPYYDPFYYDRYDRRPSQLDLAIDDIKEEYNYKISSVKDDKSLTKDERKQKVRDLKHEREDAIIEAKKSYYNKKDQAKKADEDAE